MVAEIIRYYRNEIDWDKLFTYTREYKFENVLRVGLRLSGQLLGASIPVEYIEIKGLRVKVLYWMPPSGRDCL